MKVSWRWLREYVDLDIASRELARRLTLLKYGLDDIRDFYKNDVRWLRQLDQAWL